jgi:hypothetical protein
LRSGDHRTLPLIDSAVAQRYLEGLLGSPLLIIGALIALLVIGGIIILVVGTLLFFVPALIVAGVVWWITGSEIFAGIAFLLVALRFDQKISISKLKYARSLKPPMVKSLLVGSDGAGGFLHLGAEVLRRGGSALAPSSRR